MSNHLAIATLTAALKQTVQDALDEDVPGAKARVGRPEDGGDQDAMPIVNLFLYQATPNANGRNAHLPSRNADGRLRGPSVVAMDLHYLFSFYGAANTYAPERLLGSVARALEHSPLVTRATIEKVIDENPGILDESDLQRAPEVVRASPANLSIDDLSKLWSVLFQVPYVLSVAYKCAPVFIETTLAGSPGPPVTQVNLATLTLGGPVIDTVEAAGGKAVPIVWGETVVFKGRGLSRSGLILRVGALDADLANAVVTVDRIELPLTAVSFGGAELKAGPVVAEAVLPPPQGAPAHLSRVSDRAPFALRAKLTLAADAVDAQPAQPGEPIDGTITVTFAPKIANGQDVRLLLDERAANAPKSYQLKPEPLADNLFPASELVFPFQDVRAGSYHLQALVDGTASAPEIDLNPASPTFRQIVGPTVVIP
jgi:hypothetical protein